MSKESEVKEINPRIGERNRTLDWDGIDSESLDRLKRTRGAKKGIVTKAQNEIREPMLDFGNIELIKRKVQGLKKILEEFEGAHAAYYEQLKNDRDIDESDDYFVEVKRGIEDITGDVTEWCHRNTSRTSVDNYRQHVPLRRGRIPR